MFVVSRDEMVATMIRYGIKAIDLPMGDMGTAVGQRRTIEDDFLPKNSSLRRGVFDSTKFLRVIFG
jgi:hypothetical protein